MFQDVVLYNKGTILNTLANVAGSEVINASKAYEVNEKLCNIIIERLADSVPGY